MSLLMTMDASTDWSMIIRALRVEIEHLPRGESNFSIRILTFLPDNVNYR